VNGADGNIIGGTIGGMGNIVSGNTQYGLFISDPGTTNNIVLGNLIGTDATGTNALPNGGWGIGLWSGASSNVIGGTTAGARNVISGTTGYGYGIAIGGANSNVVEGNYIGTDISGKAAIPNGFVGIALEGGSVGNSVGGTGAGQGNLIAFNNGAGVVMYDDGTTNDSIRGNSIFSNGYLGINFNNAGVAGNHAGSAVGPNELQNYPVITNAFGLGGSTIVRGNLNSLATTAYFIDLYANVSPDYSGYGQGQTYLGTVSVATDGSGNASFAYTNTSANYAGQYISATSTDANGNTSEFSADVLATNETTPYAQFTGPFHWLGNSFVFNLTFTTNFSYHIQATTNLAARPIQWVNVTNFTATDVSLLFTDRTASTYSARFYRVVSP
jgi:titin